MECGHAYEDEKRWKSILRLEDRDYDDLQVTKQGQVLKFGNVEMFHNESFDIVSKVWGKEYHKHWFNISSSSKQRAL